jgi:hypothetical protein
MFNIGGWNFDLKWDTRVQLGATQHLIVTNVEENESMELNIRWYSELDVAVVENEPGWWWFFSKPTYDLNFVLVKVQILRERIITWEDFKKIMS